MRIAVHYGSSTNFPAILDDVPVFEQAGADAVWLGESYGFDAVSALGALAVRTERMQIGTSIIPVQTRSPTLIAMTAASLDALSGGRMNLGLGTSGPQVVEGFHDVPFGPPLVRTRRVVETCRAVWRREEIVTGRVEVTGSPYRGLKLMQHPIRESIPITIAAVGERNTALAAEVADGWMPIFFWPERHKDVWGDALAAGAEKRASSLAPLEVVVSAPVAIDGRADELIARQRAGVAHYVGGMGTRETNFYNRLFRRYGFEDEADQIQNHYLAKRRSEAAALVPDAFLEQTTIAGTADEVRRRLEAYAAAGVTTLNVNPVGATLDERAAQLARLCEIAATV